MSELTYEQELLRGYIQVPPESCFKCGFSNYMVDGVLCELQSITYVNDNDMGWWFKARACDTGLFERKLLAVI